MIGATHIPKENPVADWFRDRGIPVIRVDTTGMSPDEVAAEIDAQLAQESLTMSIQKILDDDAHKLEPKTIKLESIGDVLDRMQRRHGLGRPMAKMTDVGVLTMLEDAMLECSLRGISIPAMPEKASGRED